MKFRLSFALLFAVGSNLLFAQKSYTGLVNPMVGTGGHGHTFPGPVLPFGMVQVGPDTRIDGSWDGCSGYHYSDSIIYGFSHTHLSGTGCSDFGDIMIQPIMRTAGASVRDEVIPNHYRSAFNHANESASPGYYSVVLNKHDIKVELTTSNRVGFHRYSFPKNGSPAVVLDLNHRDHLLNGYLKKVNDSTFQGVRESKAWAKQQRIYFTLYFSKKPVRYTFLNDTIESRNDLGTKEGNLKALFEFAPGTTLLETKVSISGVYFTGTENNYLSEAHQVSFDKQRKLAEAAWNKELGKIEVKGGTNLQQRIFYTALYHCFIHPSTFSDVDGRFCGRDFKIYRNDNRVTTPNSTYYSVFSLWDTFRALHPLFNLVQRQRNLDFIKTFIEQEHQSGRMPMWELGSNETDCMIGYHSMSVLADAYSKGIRGFNETQAWNASMNTMKNHQYGMETFRTQHYLSVEDEGESVSKTLEYAFNHWCLNQFGRMSKQSTAATDLLHHGFPPGQEWQLIFNTNSGFPQPRYNGGFLFPFVPHEVNNHFTEANAWQYSTFVPQDIEGLVRAHGGKAKFEQHLDKLFTASSQTVGRNQADITGLIGQYAHGNEPSHHMAYLYNFTDHPEKTKALVKRIMAEMYHDAPDGLSGNEDCGQMSAWYVMSAMGFYPVTPGVAAYQMGEPIFDEVILHNNEKETATIRYSKQGDALNWSVNNGPWKTSTTLFHQELFPMHACDTTNYAASKEMLPMPTIVSGDRSFKDSTEVRIATPVPGATIYYRVKYGAIGNDEVQLYTKPIVLKESATIEAWSLGGNEIELRTSGVFKKKRKNWNIDLATKFSDQYTAGGAEGLIDDIEGDTEWRKGGWQGYYNKDFQAVIDLRSAKTINEVSSRYLQDQKAWIFFPKDVRVEFSADGVTYFEPQLLQVGEIPRNESTEIKVMSFRYNKPVTARYVRISATNFGKLPSWHPGFGDNAYIFIDEIDIK